MSDADRKIWQMRYQQNAYAQRTHPSNYLTQWIPKLPVGTAIDLGCGSGRNARYLAEHGFTVDAIDISSHALKTASQQSASDAIQWIEGDLDVYLPNPQAYDLVCCFRYPHPQRLQVLPQLVRPGGNLIIECHMRTTTPVAGPDGDAHRVEPGTLTKMLSGLMIVNCFEGLITDPDGQRICIARAVAARPKLCSISEDVKSSE